MRANNSVSVLFFCFLGAILGLLVGLGYSHRLVEYDPDLVTIMNLICVVFGIRFGFWFHKLALYLWDLIKSEK